VSAWIPAGDSILTHPHTRRISCAPVLGHPRASGDEYAGRVCNDREVPARKYQGGE
jgi:hypothetical protein